MVTVTIYKDNKSWRAKWGDRDVHFNEFYLGVGLTSKKKLLELFGPTKPTITFIDPPDTSIEDATNKLVEYIDKVYAGE